MHLHPSSLHQQVCLVQVRHRVLAGEARATACNKKDKHRVLLPKLKSVQNIVYFYSDTLILIGMDSLSIAVLVHA